MMIVVLIMESREGMGVLREDEKVEDEESVQ
jgi:hypothetical protein